MSTIKLNTDCICLGHLASNARALQKKSQSERAYYSSHIISMRFWPSVRSRCLHISQGLFCVLWTYTTNRPISGHLDSTSLVNKGFVIFKELEKPSSFSLYFSACGVLTLTINGGSHGKLTGQKAFLFPFLPWQYAPQWVYATGRIEEEDGKTLECDKHDRVIMWVFCRDLHFTLMFLVFHKKSWLRKREVWRKFISNKIIVTLVTQGLPSSFLSRPVA